MKILLIYILLFALVNYSSCCTGVPNTKEDCLNQATSYSRCCYNGDTKRCLSLGSNRLVDYYKLLKRENTNNIDCGFVARDEINYCSSIIPYPSSNATACYEYNMIIPDVGNDGNTRSYRCCMEYDEYFRHKCGFQLMGETDYEITVLKRGAVSGKHSLCKNNNYKDTLLQCAYSNNVGINKCSKNIISSEDAFFDEGYTYDRCCYVSYETNQFCSPFPSDDDFIEDFLNKKKNEGYSSYLIKCGVSEDDTNYNSNSDDFDKEVTVSQCESTTPKSINDCTKHTIMQSEIKTIQGIAYDKCCFYEVGNGDNSCAVLPNDKNFLNDLKKNSKYGKSKINLIDCHSNYIMNHLVNLLILSFVFLY
jgi:hypothetical protein